VAELGKELSDPVLGKVVRMAMPCAARRLTIISGLEGQASRAVALDNNAATEDLALLGSSPHVSLPAKRQPYDQERQWRAEKQCANWQEIDFRRDCQDHHAGDGILSFGDDVLFANPTLSPGARRIKPPTTHDQNPVEQDDAYVPTPGQRWKGHARPRFDVNFIA